MRRLAHLPAASIAAIQRWLGRRRMAGYKRMGNTLLVTALGKNPDPVKNTIETVRPQRALLVVSADTIQSVDALLASLPSELNLGRGNCAILSVGPDQDDAGKCMRLLRSKVDQELSDWLQSPDHKVTVDITTGTKSMSIAIILLVRRWQFTLHYAGGGRGRDGAVQAGSEKHIEQMNPLYEHGIILAEDACTAFNQGFPEVAAKQVEAFKKRESRQDRKEQMQTLEQLCQGYAKWDRFQHADASKALHGVLKQRARFRFFQESDEHCERLADQIDNHVAWLDSLAGDSAEAHRRRALDLVANAERTARLHRYDDAVARLYRACEMHAQNQLRGHGLLAAPKTTVRWDRVPASLQGEWAPRCDKDGALRLGLRDLYRLLQELGDELGARFGQSPMAGKESPLENRNNSILAHGNSPTTPEGYDGFRRALQDLMGWSPADLPKPFPQIGPTPLVAREA
jgi:CRISPR-associated protein (TIGR02710 family)